MKNAINKLIGFSSAVKTALVYCEKMTVNGEPHLVVPIAWFETLAAYSDYAAKEYLDEK